MGSPVASRFQAAQSACQQLLPAATSSQQQARQCMQAGVCPQALVQQMLTADRSFARCMRAHGIPSWPDPTTDRSGQPVFDIGGIDPDSPRVSNTADECTHLLVQSTTGPTTIQLCNGIGEDGGCGGYGDPGAG